MENGSMVAEGMTVSAIMGPVLGGYMVHGWIDVITFIVTLVIAARMKGGKIMQVVLLLGAGAFIGSLIMFLGQPMWLASTARSLIFLTAVLWLYKVFNV